MQAAAATHDGEGTDSDQDDSGTAAPGKAGGGKAANAKPSAPDARAEAIALYRARQRLAKERERASGAKPRG